MGKLLLNWLVETLKYFRNNSYYKMTEPLLAPAKSVSTFLFAIVIIIVIYLLWKFLSNK